MRYRRLRIEGAAYFFTVVTHERRKLFREAVVVDLLVTAIEHVRQRHPFEVEAQVVLPDHLHAIRQLPDGDADFSTRWRLIKEGFTKSYLKRYSAPEVSVSRQKKQEQALWQRRFWEHLISDERDFSEHLDYIHYNPVRHGLVSAPMDWPHSTFKDWVARGVYEPDWGSQQMPKLPPWAHTAE